MVGDVRAYDAVWVGEEFSTLKNGDAMRFMMVPSTLEIYLALNRMWVRQYITKDLRTGHDCSVGRVEENMEIEKLGRKILKKSVDLKRSGE